MTARADVSARPIAGHPGSTPRTAGRGAVALAIRRFLVVAGMVASIVLGALTVRAAAAWAATSAPLAAPVSVTDVTAKLAQEQARSAALEQQIAELNARTAELSGALDAAQQQIASGTAAATSLQAKLTVAKHRLAALTKSLRASGAAAAAAVTVPTPTSVPTATSGTISGGEPEHGGDD
jgi:TolA-binding protein